MLIISTITLVMWRINFDSDFLQGLLKVCCALKLKYSANDKISTTFHITLIPFLKGCVAFRVIFISKDTKTSYKVAIRFLCGQGH